MKSGNGMILYKMVIEYMRQCTSCIIKFQQQQFQGKSGKYIKTKHEHCYAMLYWRKKDEINWRKMIWNEFNRWLCIALIVFSPAIRKYDISFGNKVQGEIISWKGMSI